LNSIDSKSLHRIDERDSNEEITKAIDLNIIDNLKEIIDSVSLNLSLNKTSNSENESSDEEEEEDVEKNKKSKKKRRSSVNLKKNNLNNLKICIDNIEELIDKNNKTCFVFVIHVWNISVPQEFKDDGESCTSWSVKR
jgi:hypothetical protein